MRFFKVLIIILLPVSLLGQADFVSFLPEATVQQQVEEFRKVRLIFEVLADYHIQADPSQIRNEFLIPSIIQLDSLEGLQLCEIQFPQAHNMLLGGRDSIQVFDGRVEINLIVEIDDSFSAQGISGKFYYQACNDKKCFFPREQAFFVEVNMLSTVRY